MTDTKHAQQRSLWTNVSFMLMWSSVAASGFGDRLIQLACEPMLGVNLPGTSAASISAAILFFFFLPYMCLTLVGGYLADRLPRKWIMLACDETRALVLLIAYWMVASTQLSSLRAVSVDEHWKIYLILLCTGACAAIFNPAKLSTLPQIVRSSHLQQANSILAGITLIASLIGILIGGSIISRNVSHGIMTGVFVFAISGLFFAFMKVNISTTAKQNLNPTTQRKRPKLAALSYLFTHRHAAELVILNILFWAAAWVVNASVSALVKSRHVGIEDYIMGKSIMLGAIGGGMLVGSLFVLWVKTKRESGMIAMTSLVAVALCMLLLAWVPMYELGLVIAFFIGLLGGIFLICIDTLTQSITPNHLRGRIFGLRSLLNTISAVVVNYFIWQADNSDQHIIIALYITSAILLVMACLGFWQLCATGPCGSWPANCLWRVNRLYAFVWHRLDWRGKENLPAFGPYILAANHTTGIDPLIIQAINPRIIRWVMLRAYKTPLLNWVWKINQPIAMQDGQPSLSDFKHMLQVLKQGHILGIYPEGALQRDSRTLKPFQAGIGMLAAKSGVPIVPIWISGTPRAKHLLWHFLLPSKSHLHVGTPFVPDHTLTHPQIADQLRQRLLQLA